MSHIFIFFSFLSFQPPVRVCIQSLVSQDTIAPSNDFSPRNILISVAIQFLRSRTRTQEQRDVLTYRIKPTRSSAKSNVRKNIVPFQGENRMSVEYVWIYPSWQFLLSLETGMKTCQLMTI